jgi:transcriptional regulator with XRE-family HTH domain
MNKYESIGTARILLTPDRVSRWDGCESSQLASSEDCDAWGNSMKKSPNPVDKHVGSRVRMRRLMLGMSQEKLGIALGLTFQQVQKYEKGTNRIGASRLQHIASILQVPVSFFFEDAPINRSEPAQISDAPSPDLVTAFVSTTDGLKLIQAFASIRNTALRRCIVQLVEHIARPPHD